MSLWSFLWGTVNFANSLDNRYRKRVAKNTLDFVASATDSKLLSDFASNASKNISNTPLSGFETNQGMNKSIINAATTKAPEEKKSDDIKTQKTNDGKSNAWTAWSSWSPSTSTVSNNKTNNNMNKTNNNPTTSTAPAKPKPVQYQPDEYEAYRQRTMNNWTTYNQVYEDAVNRFLANPDSFTQEQRDALIQMWNKLWYDLWTTSTSTYTAPAVTTPSVSVQNSSAHDKYYASQWTPLWFIL